LSVSTWCSPAGLTEQQQGGCCSDAALLQPPNPSPPPPRVPPQDDGVNLHSLPDLAPRAAAAHSARAAALAWHPGRCELAVASKRKVIAHRLAGGGSSCEAPAAGAGGDGSGPAMSGGGGAKDGISGKAGSGGKEGSGGKDGGKDSGGPLALQELTEYALPENAECVSWVGDAIVVGEAAPCEAGFEGGTGRGRWPRGSAGAALKQALHNPESLRQPPATPATVAPHGPHRPTPTPSPGTKRSYYLIIPAPPQSVEVLPGQVMQIYPTVAPQLLAPLGAAPAPALAPLPAEDGGSSGEGGGAAGPGELLICRDSGSFFVGPDGKVRPGWLGKRAGGERRHRAACWTWPGLPTHLPSLCHAPTPQASRKASLQWSEPAAALAAGRGYAVALLPGRVEVKSVSRIAAAAAGQQHIPLPGMAVASLPSPADGSLFLAAAAPGGGVRRLRPVPPAAQARALAAAGDFPGALELCGRLPEGPERRRLEDSLRLRFCHHLFSAGDTDDALTQLSMCSDAAGQPLLLLRLFPGLVPPKFQGLLPTEAYGEPLPPLDAPDGGSEGAAPGGEGGGKEGASGGDAAAAAAAAPGPAARDAAAVGVVVPYLLSYRTRLLAAMGDAQAGGPDRGGSGGGAAAAAAAAGEGRGKPRRAAVRRPGQPRPPAAAADALADGAAAAPPAPAPRMAGSGDGGAASGDGGGPMPEAVAAVLDTALLLAMLAQPDSGAALRLLQQRNFVDAEVGEAALGAAGRYAELAALLQYTGQVRARQSRAVARPMNGQGLGLTLCWVCLRLAVSANAKLRPRFAPRPPARPQQHAKGLDLLRRLSQDPASLSLPPAGAAADLAGLPGVWAAVRCAAPGQGGGCVTARKAGRPSPLLRSRLALSS
jgi:hypothetical protein